MKFLKSQTTNRRGIRNGLTGMYFDHSTQVFDFRSSSAMRVLQGSDAQRSQNAQLGLPRFNTTNNSVEFYDNGVWKEIRLKEPIPITQQSLGTGDGVETVFGSLMQTTPVRVLQTAQSVLVLVENVLQIPTTNYTLEQSTSGIPGSTVPSADGYYI